MRNTLNLTGLTIADLAGTAFLINAKRADQGKPPVPGLREDGTLEVGSEAYKLARRAHRQKHIDAMRKGRGSSAYREAVEKGEGPLIGLTLTGGSGAEDDSGEAGSSECDPAKAVEAMDAAAYLLDTLPASQGAAVRIAAAGLEGAAKAHAWANRTRKDGTPATMADLLALGEPPAMTPDEVRKATAACRQALAKARRKMADAVRVGGPLDGLGLGAILGKGSGRRVTA